LEFQSQRERDVSNMGVKGRKRGFKGDFEDVP
jgi:hypothetical protein